MIPQNLSVYTHSRFLHSESRVAFWKCKHLLHAIWLVQSVRNKGTQPKLLQAAVTLHTTGSIRGQTHVQYMFFGIMSIKCTKSLHILPLESIKMIRYLPLFHCLVAQWFPEVFFPTQNDCLLRWAIGVRRFVAWLRVPPRKGRFFQMDRGRRAGIFQHIVYYDVLI